MMERGENFGLDVQCFMLFWLIYRRLCCNLCTLYGLMDHKKRNRRIQRTLKHVNYILESIL